MRWTSFDPMFCTTLCIPETADGTKNQSWVPRPQTSAFKNDVEIINEKSPSLAAKSGTSEKHQVCKEGLLK